MSTLLEEPPVVEESPAVVRAVGETMAASVVILLVMTVAQRLIGFGRGIMFCRWLDPEQLGQWDVAFGFLNLAAPLVVLGLPGSFGRYVEYYRQRGQFHTFLRRTVAVTIVTSLLAIGTMFVARDWFSNLIFGGKAETRVILALAFCLLTVIFHNFLVSLFIAVRRYRVVTALQFFQGMGFAFLSLALLTCWPLGVTSVVLGYAGATLLASLGAIACVRKLTLSEPKDAAVVGHASFWAKLVPFAAWMWITNILANLFEVIDRYMIVHHSGLSIDDALRLVGNYHSSRIVPLLFVGVTGLIGSLITPHLTHDWELGRHTQVVRRLNLTLKVIMGSLLSGSIAVLFLAPLLFNFGFQNKFQGGLDVLPFTLAYCTWFGTIGVAQNYLWCAERAGLGSLTWLLGLLLNIGLNLVLLPRFGLAGAACATASANLVALLLTYQVSRLFGMRIDLGTLVYTLAPISLCFGAWVALGVWSVLAVLTLSTGRLLHHDEKQELLGSLQRGLAKVRGVASRIGKNRNLGSVKLASK